MPLPVPPEPTNPQPIQLQPLQQQYEATDQAAGNANGFTYRANPRDSEKQRLFRQRVDAIKQSPEGQAIRQFVTENAQGRTPNAKEQLQQYRSTVDTVTLSTGEQIQEHLTWKAFQELATETLGNQQSFGEFVERVSYQPPVRTELEGEGEMLQAPAEDNNEEIKSKNTEADDYAARYLAFAQAEFVTSHQRFMETYENQRDRRGNITGIATGLYQAIEVAFGEGSSRGGNKKWKELLAKLHSINPRLVGDKVNALIPTLRSIPKAIDAEILQSKENMEEPSSVVHLRAAIKSKDPQIRKTIETFVFECAKIVATNRTGGNELSMNSEQADNVSLGDTLASQEDIEPSMKASELNAANSAWDAFIGNPQNSQAIQSIRQLKHGRDESGDQMIPALVQRMKISEGEIVKEAIHTAFTGWSDSGEEKWKEFYAKYPQLSQQPSLRNMAEIATGARPGLESLQAFVVNASYEFLVKKYEEMAIDLNDRLNEVVPGVGNLKTVQRLNRLVEGYLLRNYKWMKMRGKENAFTSARRYTLIKTRMDAMMVALQRLITGNEPIQLTDDRRIYRSKLSSGIIMQHKQKGEKRGDPEQWVDVRVLEDQDFPLLQNAIKPEQWVPRAIELMRTRFANEPKIMKREERDTERDENGNTTYVNEQNPQDEIVIAAGQKPPKGYVPKLSSIGREMDAACVQYRQQHPDEPDRLKGFRILMGQKIRQAREAAGLDINALAERIAGPKRRGPKGRLISDPVGMITALENGAATRYSYEDLAKLAESLGLASEKQAPDGTTKVTGDPSRFYTRPDEFDPNCADDLTALQTLINTAFWTFGPYLVHRKKESIRRNIRNDFFNQRTMYLYLSLMRPHGLLSSKPKQRAGGKDKVSDQKIGKFLYQLIGKPLTDDLTMDQVRENIGNVPTEDVNDPGYKVPDFRGPRTMTNPDTGLQEDLPPDLVHRYYYDDAIARDPNPNPPEGGDPSFIPEEDQPKHPNDIRRKFYQLDPTRWLDRVQEIPYKGEPRRLQYYIDEKMNQLREQANTTTPEHIEENIDQADPTSVARMIVKKVWPKRKVDGRWIDMDDATAQHILENKMERANAYSQRKNLPTHYQSLDQFASNYIQKELSTMRYFREKAKKELQWLPQKMQEKPIDQIRYFVPASVRRQAALTKMVDEGGNVPISPLRDANDMEKYDSSRADILIAALDELEQYGEMVAISSGFTHYNAELDRMIEKTARSSMRAVAEYA